MQWTPVCLALDSRGVRNSEHTRFTLRNPALDRVHRSAFAKRVVYRLPAFLQPRPEPYGLVVELDEDGEVLRSFHDPGGEVFGGVTSAKERDSVLYFGTLEQEWLGRMEL